ncbi:histidine phosphatase family protein [Paenibacillus amylolyticus]|uniref:Histidine phosphatase family protein n=1 Tax=Paenibacillus amylolyticus TaxID=1451 RepID=A0ABD8B2L9_PAEAM
MEDLHLDRLISSPYLRAWQTAETIADRLKLKLEPNEERLREREISESSGRIPDKSRD